MVFDKKSKKMIWKKKERIWPQQELNQQSSDLESLWSISFEDLGHSKSDNLRRVTIAPWGQLLENLFAIIKKTAKL